MIGSSCTCPVLLIRHFMLVVHSMARSLIFMISPSVRRSVVNWRAIILTTYAASSFEQRWFLLDILGQGNTNYHHTQTLCTQRCCQE
ncbi:unnamed protein product [Lathyrus oleraceus]